MKRSFVLAAALLLSGLALTFSTPYNNRAVNAAPLNKCDKCVAKVQRTLDRCEARSGGPTQACYDQYNAGISHCYATVCEQ
jgi:hypothetical protein